MNYVYDGANPWNTGAGTWGYTAAKVLKRARFSMRVLQVLGAILILGGLFVLIKSPSYSSQKSVLKIGDVEAKVSQEHAIPPWAGGAAVAVGIVLIVVGARKP